MEGDVSTVIIMDDAYAVYVHFRNATDENAPVEFLDRRQAKVLQADGEGIGVVFAAWKVLKEKGLGVR